MEYGRKERVNTDHGRQRGGGNNNAVMVVMVMKVNNSDRKAVWWRGGGEKEKERKGKREKGEMKERKTLEGVIGHSVEDIKQAFRLQLGEVRRLKGETGRGNTEKVQKIKKEHSSSRTRTHIHTHI
jgi:hypothetical protein